MNSAAEVGYFILIASNIWDNHRNNMQRVIYNLVSSDIAIIQVTTFNGYYGYLGRYTV